MTGIEDRLRDALAAKAGSVRDDGRPRVLPPPHSRPAAMNRRTPRSRLAAMNRRTPRSRLAAFRWWAPLAVAATLVLVVAISFATTRAVTPPTPHPAQRPTPYVGPLAPPVEQVWPDAVHEIPATAPGKRAFKPDVFISPRVVAGRGLTRNRPDSIWSYDVDKRRFTRITTLTSRYITNEPVVFGDGQVAWTVLRDRKLEIWAVPVTGGAPRRLAAVTATITSDNEIIGARNLTIADGTVWWSPAEGGVYRLPLKGGTPTLITGTRGFHLLEWPWAGEPRDDRSVDHPIPRPMEHLKNVRTGETRDATPPSGRTSWKDCGVTWCLSGVETWRRDGTGLRALPGQAVGDLYSGRYVMLRQRDATGGGAAAVHDLATGRTGTLFRIPTRRGDKASPTLHAQQGMFWYRTERGTQVLIRLLP
ncbi:anti-sigma factor [Nonomuraea sp. PA05]|uniref:anti-sigma factor n=1 Tax=Nonomuraea sp. PA05 TaxID=2604466 RepID=UPI0011D3217B|nr:anti-sigma factor [Nonomuraea sp. PA05]TYB71109.1 anti-sigma factor [Nonomuraea sp. PA05]